MLEIKNLTIYMKKDLRNIIENFTFSLGIKDKVALIGEEGNGKSTLLKAIYNLNLISDYAEIHGKINKNKEVIAYLPQYLNKKALNLLTIEYLSNVIDMEVLDYNLLYKLINKFKLSDNLFYNKIKLGQLSGGERIKFLLICELLKKPTILLLDEPSNDLDLSSIIWIENFIKTSKIPVLFVSHDEMLLKNCANVIIHFEQIKRKSKCKYTIARLDYLSYIKNRNYQIKKQIQISNKENEEFNKKIKRYKEIYQKAERDQKNVSRQDPNSAKNLKDKIHSLKSMGKRFEKVKQNLTQNPDFERGISIKINNDINIYNDKLILDFHLDKLNINDRILSKNIDLKVFGSTKIGIIGNNGCGKTTLIKHIVEYLKNKNANFFYMPQNYIDNIDLNITPVEFLAKDSSKCEFTKVGTYLGSAKFTRDEMFHHIKDLSGGQMAKLFFYKIALNNFEILVLDEPTRNLSPLSSEQIISVLKNFNGSIISISHDRTYLMQVCDELHFLSKIGLKKIDKNNI